MTPRAQEGSTRDRLLEACLAALREMTAADLVSAIGTREIARRAGLSPAAVYKHFESVGDLADAVIARIFDPVTLPTEFIAAGLTELMRAQLPTDAYMTFNRSEFDRLHADESFQLRMGLWAFGGDAALAAYRRYLQVTDDQLAIAAMHVTESWGREPTPPFDWRDMVAAAVALLNGSIVRARTDPERMSRDTFSRVATLNQMILSRFIGDRRTFDDRIAEANYYPLRHPRSQQTLSGKRELTRSRILDAAAKRFGSDGFEETSVANIARSAQVSVSAVYKLFVNKSELAVALWSKQAADMVSALTANGPVDLSSLLTALADFALTHRELAGPYLLACQLPDAGAPADDVLLDAVVAACRTGAEQGSLPAPFASDETGATIMSAVISASIRFPSKGAASNVAAVLTQFGAAHAPAQRRDRARGPARSPSG